jgi:hypothetical protein
VPTARAASTRRRSTLAGELASRLNPFRKPARKARRARR